MPPEFTFDVPANISYGLPPAILPIWSSPYGPNYIGLLKHWFGNREVTFVDYHIEAQKFTEIARTPDQLRVRLVFDFLRNVPDFEEVCGFAEAVGLCSISEVEFYFQEYLEKDDLAGHPLFSGNLPLEYVNDDEAYCGDFLFKEVDLRNYCSFEIPDTFLANTPDIPSWFENEGQPELFYELLASDDLSGAWYCLNSKGWETSEMKIAIQQLSSKSEDSVLEMLSGWLLKNIPDGFRY